jgi:hypothetical protein
MTRGRWGRGKFRTGRRQPGEMNATERAYADVLTARVLAGELLAWDYEPLTFKLARSCRYTPDFIVQLPDGTIEAHEVKIHTGSKLLAEDDAKAKIRVAAEKFGMLVWRIAAKQPKKLGGGWLYFLVGEEF